LFDKIDNVRNIILNEVIRQLEEQDLEITDVNIQKIFKKTISKIMNFYLNMYSEYMRNFKK